MESFVEKVYPHLTDKFVASITANFNLGQLISWTGIPGGWSNVNIKLETKTGAYVVRFYRYGARSYADIELEFAVLDRLAINLPVAPALVNTKGHRMIATQLAAKRIYYAVFKYLEGQQILVPNDFQLQALGQALAQIHKGLFGFSSGHIRKYWYFKAEIGKIKRKIIKRAIGRPWQFAEQIALPDFIDFVNLETKLFSAFEKKFKKNLKAESIIHGDFHAANVLFENNKVLGIFDFDSLMHAPTILDLAICTANLRMQSAEHGSNYSLSQILKFIKTGYEKKIKLSHEQKQVLPVLVRFWLFSQLAWTLKWPQTTDQQYFYQQVFARVVAVLKEKLSGVN